MALNVRLPSAPAPGASPGPRSVGEYRRGGRVGTRDPVAGSLSLIELPVFAGYEPKLERPGACRRVHGVARRPARRGRLQCGQWRSLRPRELRVRARARGPVPAPAASAVAHWQGIGLAPSAEPT
jgi:hypothetical protein